ncbi:hypothetical protein ICE98_02118 [Lactococcus lactis]|nr:hypothetical protein [Lactococcus lactis]
MIGQVENITRFGLFVKISTDKLTDEIKKVLTKLSVKYEDFCVGHSFQRIIQKFKLVI